MWFILAILALLCWSGSDIFSKVGTQQNDKYSHWKMVIAVGTVMGIHALITIICGVRVTFTDILTYLPVSVMYILSMVIGYAGLRYIELSVSSPICNSSGAIAAILCFFILKQEMDALTVVGVVLVCAGVIALGIVEAREDDAARELRQQNSNRKYSKSLLALTLPVLYCIIDAAGTFGDAVVLDESFKYALDENVANTAYELTFLFMAVVAFVYVVIIKKQKLSFANDKFKGVAAVCETAGQFAYVYAIGDYAIGAAPIISAYCVVSALWGRIFLKEKLSFKHYLVISVVVIGIILMGVAEGISGDA